MGQRPVMIPPHVPVGGGPVVPPPMPGGARIGGFEHVVGRRYEAGRSSGFDVHPGGVGGGRDFGGRGSFSSSFGDRRGGGGRDREGGRGRGGGRSGVRPRGDDLDHISLPKPDFRGLIPFKKDFYVECPSVRAMSEQEVVMYRARREITVEGHDVPKPIRMFQDASFPGISFIFLFF